MCVWVFIVYNLLNKVNLCQQQDKGYLAHSEFFYRKVITHFNIIIIIVFTCI